MLLGDGRHQISSVGSKRSLKDTEKIVCRELPGWGSLAALCRQAEAGWAVRRKSGTCCHLRSFP